MQVQLVLSLLPPITWLSATQYIPTALDFYRLVLGLTLPFFIYLWESAVGVGWVRNHSHSLIDGSGLWYDALLYSLVARLHINPNKDFKPNPILNIINCTLSYYYKILCL